MVAHAFGERYDSPVPLALFVLGGLLAMVGYTVLSLWLLALPLVEQAPSSGAS